MRRGGGVGVFDKEYQSAPVNCKADLPFVQVIYKKILNKSNAILAACLHLLATFGLECRAFACKKKLGFGGGERPLPFPVRRLCIVRDVSAVFLRCFEFEN